MKNKQDWIKYYKMSIIKTAKNLLGHFMLGNISKHGERSRPFGVDYSFKSSDNGLWFIA